jgi:N-acetylneuraminic acid mutarotase
VGDAEDGFYIFGRASSAVFKPDANKWTVFETHVSNNPRTNGATAVVGKNIYLLGGLAGRTVSDRVDIFDASSGKFSQGVSLTSPRADHSAAAYDGKIYIFGGSAKVGVAMSTVEMFDPSSGKWSTKAPMLEAWAEMCTGPLPVFANGAVMIPHSYRNNKEYLGSLEYDTVTDQWKRGPQMVRPVGRYVALIGTLA